MSVQIIDKPLVTELNDDDNVLVQSAGGVTKRISFRSLAKQANFVINDIGKAGGLCFGVGIAPRLPVYLEPLPGTFVKGDEYGNYKCVTDGSIIDYVPKFYFKISNDTAAPYYGNKVEIKSALDFPDEATANAAGYALHRAFIDGGAIKDGFFIDKYNWSLTNFINGSAGIASSVKNGNPISSAVATRKENKNISAVTSDVGSNSYKVTCAGHGASAGTTVQLSGTGLFGLDTSLIIGYTNNIATISSSGTTAAVTTALQHGLETGDSVTISGTGITAYNITAVITKTGTNTFTYTIASTTNSASVGSVSYNFAADTLRLRVTGATGTFSGSATLSKLQYAGSFSNCISNAQTPVDIYGGAWAAAKSRGNDFAVATIFQHSAISLLALAHAQASTSAVNCAWYDATGVKNFPKGNNQVGTDTNDNAVTFSACDDAYWAGRNEARKTGSGSNFAKTTHNGQNCGISDLNGNQYTIYQGLTCIAVGKAITAISKSLDANDPAIFTAASHGYITGNLIFIDGTNGDYNALLQYRFFDVDVIDTNTFKLKIRSAGVTNGNYVNTSGVTPAYTSGFSSAIGTGSFLSLKENIAVKNVTGGLGGPNDHFGNATIFDLVDISASLVDHYTSQGFGNGTNQVLNMDIVRTNNNYKLTSLGLPGSKTALGGSNQFGNDWYYKFVRDGLCPIAGGSWGDGSVAGLWCLYLSGSRGDSGSVVSGRSCLYV